MVNLEVVGQHAEDAAFLWQLRDRATRAPHFYLKDLSRLDERVEANIDGLRIAGPAGWGLAAKALEQKLPGEVFVAAVLAFESKIQERMDAVLNVIAEDAALIRPVVSALGWLRFEDVSSALEGLVRSQKPERREIGIAGYAVHRAGPGEALRQMLADANPGVQSRAFKAAGELGQTGLALTIVRSMTAADSLCRFYATWSVARLGVRDRDVLDVLRAFVVPKAPFAEAALQMAVRCMGLAEAQNWISGMLTQPEQLRLGIVGLGAIGDPAHVSELIAFMQVEKVARVAGEAFSMITGVDLKYADLDTDAPESVEAGPNDDPSDPDVAMDADEDLPWPSPDRVRKWWEKHEHEFHPGVRYLRGKPIGPAGLLDALKNGYQRQRTAAALELALLQPATPMFEVRAPGRRQAEVLTAWSS